MNVLFLMTTLIISESSMKNKTFEQVLHEPYTYFTTSGNFVEFKFENSTYSIYKNKLGLFTSLRTILLNTKQVILAFDNTPEGDHLCDQLCAFMFLDPQHTYRLTINDLTESSIRHAIQTMTQIKPNNHTSVFQTRQKIDFMYGFLISPALWGNVKGYGLSAGRYQGVALGILHADHEKRRQANNELVIKNTVVAYFSSMKFTLDGKLTQAQISTFIEASKTHDHKMLECVETLHIRTEAPKPFTTLSLLCFICDKCNISPDETMTICQSLYEQGYITSPYSDCETYDDEFIKSVISFVSSKYSPMHALEKYESICSPTNCAIRPTDITLQNLSNFTKKETEIYGIIWKRSIQSCMSPQIHSRIVVTASSPMPSYNYVFTTNTVQFKGWAILNTLDCSSDFNTVTMSVIYGKFGPVGSTLNLTSLCATEEICGMIPYMNESQLLQSLASRGIGRPYTYSGIIHKLIDKKYVIKQNIHGDEYILNMMEMNYSGTIATKKFKHTTPETNKLVLQPIGINVFEFLNQYFGMIYSTDYIGKMETEIDTLPASTICNKCDCDIHELLKRIPTPVYKKNESKFIKRTNTPKYK